MNLVYRLWYNKLMDRNSLFGTGIRGFESLRPSQLRELHQFPVRKRDCNVKELYFYISTFISLSQCNIGYARVIGELLDHTSTSKYGKRVDGI